MCFKNIINNMVFFAILFCLSSLTAGGENTQVSSKLKNVISNYKVEAGIMAGGLAVHAYNNFKGNFDFVKKAFDSASWLYGQGKNVGNFAYDSTKEHPYLAGGGSLVATLAGGIGYYLYNNKIVKQVKWDTFFKERVENVEGTDIENAFAYNLAALSVLLKAEYNNTIFNFWSISSGIRSSQGPLPEIYTIYIAEEDDIDNYEWASCVKCGSIDKGKGWGWVDNKGFPGKIEQIRNCFYFKIDYSPLINDLLAQSRLWLAPSINIDGKMAESALDFKSTINILKEKYKDKIEEFKASESQINLKREQLGNAAEGLSDDLIILMLSLEVQQD